VDPRQLHHRHSRATHVSCIEDDACISTVFSEMHAHLHKRPACLTGPCYWTAFFRVSCPAPQACSHAGTFPLFYSRGASSVNGTLPRPPTTVPQEANFCLARPDYGRQPKSSRLGSKFFGRLHCLPASTPIPTGSLLSMFRACLAGLRLLQKRLRLRLL
jgi:hypothetical protein